MIILINDVVEHFNCSLNSAAKITRFLTKASNVNMNIKDTVDFKFCGVMYSLSRHEGDWIMIRSLVTRSTDLDDVL